jgi:hypothetical protein
MRKAHKKYEAIIHKKADSEDKREISQSRVGG